MQNPLPIAVPAEGYVVEIAGSFNAVYGSFTAALQAGLELKHKDARAEVKIYDARERTAAERARVILA